MNPKYFELLKVRLYIHYLSCVCVCTEMTENHAVWDINAEHEQTEYSDFIPGRASGSCMHLF